MGKSWTHGERQRQGSWIHGSRASTDERSAHLGESDGQTFELYAEDVFEDSAIGRFAKARWSEGPRRRRSQWLRQQLDLASEGDETALGYFSQPG